MCGITGYLDFDGAPASPVILARMAEAIRHRGPDDQGIYTDGALGFGHRRLSIIDLTDGGHQPMVTPDGRYVIVYNGELYNFQELRGDLQAKGHRFQSQSDTEVVLKAFVQWGADCLGKFNGMFALAIWDCETRTLFLARDRYGIKPLYYTVIDRTFLFGSEIKAILAHGKARARIDLEGLTEYFTFQNFFSERTLFKGVSTFSAGSWMTVSADGESSGPHKFWDYHFQEPDSALSVEEYEEELDRLLQQAVSRQLVSDVEVSAYLSGGMDSGTLTAIAARQLPYIKTFTIGFDLSSASGVELGYDERARAEQMSYLFKTEHYEMVLKAGDMERSLSQLVYHLEEPRVGQSYPNLYAAKLASKFSKVVLTGTGGDEIFAGYPWRYYRAAVNNDFDHYIDKYYSYWARLLNREQIKSVFAPIWEDVKHVDTKAIMRGVFRGSEGDLARSEDYINHSLHLEAKTFLHGLLVVEDKLSMAFGLESRVPFLDNDLVDFALKVPVSMKLGNLDEIVRLNENEPGPKTSKYFQKTRDGKLILRRAMSRHIPDEITSGEKQGFSAPDGSWFRGDSIEYVRHLLYSDDARIYDYFDRNTVQSLVSEHLEGKENRRLLIWSLINFEQWCQTFLDG